eukprot:Skav224316  [mRNA]  locus=scaffold227:472719:474416:+ [translate_table: standard]
MTTCSDASLTGGAVAVSTELDQSGVNFLSSQTHCHAPEQVPVLLVSLFHGIGGSSRCYDVAGGEVLHTIAADCHGPANRVCSRRWPETVIYLDVKRITKEVLSEALEKFPGCKQVHVWAGFPCVDLSSAKLNRLNLEGSESSLFFEVLRILDILLEIKGDALLYFFIENVSSMDTAARDEISRFLKVTPIKLNPANQVPMNRPRFCWSNFSFFEVPGIKLVPNDGYVDLEVTGSWPPAEAWLEEHCQQARDDIAYPTFMKCIRRSRPPPAPAGLSRCDVPTRDRWQSADFKFPPYQFKAEYLIHDYINQADRLLVASEREVLMGFGKGHTSIALSASRAKQSPQQLEDERCSLIGDSFAVPSFGIIACYAVHKFEHVDRVSNRLGLPPGFKLHHRFIWPIGGHGPFSDIGEFKVVDLNLHLLQRTNHTGSDVRIVSGEIMNPKVFPRQSVDPAWWKWTPVFNTIWSFVEQINALEIRSIYLTLLWKLKQRGLCNRRVFHLADSSYVSLSILSKGRTGSRQLQPLCRKIASLLLAAHVLLVLGHVDSSVNPTDAASRQGKARSREA